MRKGEEEGERNAEWGGGEGRWRGGVERKAFVEEESGSTRLSHSLQVAKQSHFNNLKWGCEQRGQKKERRRVNRMQRNKKTSKGEEEGV
jgi:hypothetical protein